MKQLNDFKYKAFISYSHRDEQWGKWLHKKLERYCIPRNLRGSKTLSGTVPKRLFPVFRDREELPTASDLGQVIKNALENSSHLIVISSPNSAKSKWVNEEIKTFKKLGKQNRIICLIVNGEPNADDKENRDFEECFAPAIKVLADENGNLTDIKSEPIAADLRVGKDGKSKAFLKIIAGIIGINFDDLYKRESKRKLRRRILITLLIPFVLVNALFVYGVLGFVFVGNDVIRDMPIVINGKQVFRYPKLTNLKTKVWANPTEINSESFEIIQKGTGSISSLYLTSTGSFSFDELRVGKTFESVIPIFEDSSNLIFYDSFEYQNGQKLINQEGWYDQETDDFEYGNYLIKSGSLIYKDFPQIGNSVFTEASEIITGISKSLPKNISELILNNNRKIYISFLMQPEGVLHEGMENGFFALYLNTQVNKSLLIGKGTRGKTGEQYKIELDDGRSVSTGVNMRIGETVLIVLQLEFAKQGENLIKQIIDEGKKTRKFLESGGGRPGF